MTNKTISDLRDNLFAQLEEISDPTKQIDVERMRLRLQVAQTIINTAKVEVEFAAVVKGALEVPFIEGQAPERPGLPPVDRPAPGDAPKTPMQMVAGVLSSGPPENHPWRRSVHRLRG